MLRISLNVKTSDIKLDHVLKMPLHLIRIFVEIIFKKNVVAFELRIKVLPFLWKVDSHNSWNDCGEAVKKHNNNNNRIFKVRNIN
jgi:hypothetical protein